MGNLHFSNLIMRSLDNDIQSSYFDITSSVFNLSNLLKPYKIIHFVGSPTVSKHFIKLIWLKLAGKKIVVSWIGFDIRRARENAIRKTISKFCQQFIDENLVEDEKSLQILNKLGINSKLLPPPFYRLFEIRNLSTENKIAVYLPDDSNHFWDIYHGDWIKKLVNELPDVQFIIIKYSGKNFSEKNVICFNWIEDIEQLYSEVKGVIRLPKEDSTGLTIIEVLSMGRTMIASGTDFPFCQIVKSYDELKTSVLNTIMNPILNQEGSKYVHQNYDNKKLVKSLVHIYNLFY